MYYNNKGISSFLIIIFIVSLLISILIFSVINVVYESDIPECSQLKFEIVKSCKLSTGAKFTVKNSGSESIEFIINGERKVSEYRVPSESQNEIRVLKDYSSLDLLPIIKKNGNVFECRGKRKSINLEVLTKC
jgi:hypothetical protein